MGNLGDIEQVILSFKKSLALLTDSNKKYIEYSSSLSRKRSCHSVINNTIIFRSVKKRVL